MTLKKFSIFTSIVVGLIIVLTVVLSCVKVDGGLSSTPDRVIAYLQSTSGISCDSANNANYYNKLVKEYKKMTQLSILDYMLHGNVIDTMPGNDYDEEYDTWSYTDKQENYCLELIFKEKQSSVVKVDGDTKVIDYYGLIMVVKKTTLSHEVALYFSTTEDYETTKSYSKSPILVNANQSGILKYLKTIEEKQAENK